MKFVAWSFNYHMLICTRIILEIPPCARHVIFICLFFKIPPFYEVNSLNRKWQGHGGISEIFLLDHFSPSFLGQKCKISPIFHFDQVRYGWISHLLCVNTYFNTTHHKGQTISKGISFIFLFVQKMITKLFKQLTLK